ncbi:L-arabinonate dehydratase [Campylobacter sp. MIT 21-1685]|uniref:L-arabinonate dehydratase n=1 Tax=unclassified Campylobacter TaxID=2593542 RepID=UPI00224B3474|nr:MULTISPECIES: L-arabinonate dehydratase [unclassified Campylobacter]MCX2682511.1 L-arabinonate dehydratase [Campylobacter sp. MIT 21-1684]MCX2750776.1 L-arabinonate dehydratase [Campylobacter sp. MIT 21-1682]MCX2806992.1 L-arabinonate dehydratase [Campylobacter sp. MIT 21-1685]
MKKLRSLRWFERNDLRSFGHRSRVNQMGYSPEEYIGKPIIAIVNTWNEFNTCHTHFKERVEDIKRGVLQAGGFPLELPVMSVAEQLMKPTSMMFRNFLAMEVEEMLRAFPVDGAVLMGGCDKTTPGVLMGGFSCNIPLIYMPAGAMLRGNYRGEVLGSGTDVWKYWDLKQAGCFSECEWKQLEMGIARSAGTCMTMGTAATMMIMAEALGVSLPGASSIPAVDSNHRRMARECGVRIVALAKEDIKPSDILTRECFENAIITLNATSGSTNAIIHLLALAKRAHLSLKLDDFENIGKDIPLLLNLKPSGKYVMEDFYYAGGILALQKVLQSKLHNINTINGKKLYENIKDAEVFNPEVISTLEKPFNKEPSLSVLKGNLCPNGAILKQSACEKRLLKHRGKALVYEDIEELKANIDDETLCVDENTVLVLKNAGPVGAPGMPEWGQLPIPKKLLKLGVKDMIRISDARMSGTSYGACILHVSPESFIGGNLALVRTGDIIHLDVEKRLLELCVDEAELAERRKAYKAPKREYESGYVKLYTQYVTQADEGCDFDFLSTGNRKNQEPRIF